MQRLAVPTAYPVEILDATTSQRMEYYEHPQHGTRGSDQRKLRIRYSSLRETDMALRHSCQQQMGTTRQHQRPGH